MLPSIKTKNLDAITHTFISTLHAIFVVKPDIIHYHGVGPSLLSWIPKLLAPKIKVISTFHCIDRKHQKWGFIARLSLRMGEWAACHFADKTITTGEGGAILTNRKDLYHKLLLLRNHGIDKSAVERFGSKAGWEYDMKLLGRNYRMTDFQAALGLSQLKRFPEMLINREILAAKYDDLLKDIPENSELRLWFFEMFKYAEQSQIANPRAGRTISILWRHAI